MTDVIVAVADPCRGLAAWIATMLEPGLHVGEQLTGMMLVGEAIDDGYARVRCKFDLIGLRIVANHDRAAHPRQHLGSVADRFIAADLRDASRQEQDRKSTRLNSSH